jgi:hypothetical protein
MTAWGDFFFFVEGNFFVGIWRLSVSSLKPAVVTNVTKSTADMGRLRGVPWAVAYGGSAMIERLSFCVQQADNFLG